MYKVEEGKEEEYPLLEGRFADGGMIANNPTLAAISFVQTAFRTDPARVAVLSLGCGGYLTHLNIGRLEGGIAWFWDAIKLPFAAGAETLTVTAEQLFTSVSLLKRCITRVAMLWPGMLSFQLLHRWTCTSWISSFSYWFKC
jgi:hypothetical protein